MPISYRLFAVAFQQNMRALENIDVETQDALVKLCDPESEITRKDAEAIAIALILELREKKARRGRPGARSSSSSR
jgi:hypothetical protein